MSQDLYRKEAFESKIKGFSNPISIRGSLSSTLLITILLVTLGALAAYGWNAPYSRKVMVAGEVAPVSGSVSVRSLMAGIVNMRIQDGDSVQQGQVLAEISDAVSAQPGRSDADISRDALAARRDLLDQKLALSERRIEHVSTIAELRATNAAKAVDALAEQIAMIERQVTLAREGLERTTGLSDKSLSTRSAVEAAQANLLNAERSLIDARTKYIGAQSERSSAELASEAEVNIIKEEMIGLHAERLSIMQQLDQLANTRLKELRAPIAGRIVFSNIRDQERVGPNSQVFTIVPEDETLVAQLFATSAAIGFVKKGDPVYLRYDAYPYREHGTFVGTVSRIDSAPQSPMNIGVILPSNEPVYRVQVRIEQSPVNKRGESLRLIAGMRLSASIVADQKPILFWLLDPVF